MPPPGRRHETYWGASVQLYPGVNVIWIGAPESGMSSQSAARVDGVENREKEPKRAGTRVCSRMKTRGEDDSEEQQPRFILPTPNLRRHCVKL